MATITTRAGKGSPLTNTELDANFTNLNSDKLETSGGTLTGDLSFGDGDKAIFGGVTSELQIYSDGSNSYVDEQGSGGLNVRGTNLNLTDSDGVRFLRGESGGPTRFYHQGTEVLTSTSTGIDVTGTVTADGLTVDGSTGSTVNIQRNDTGLLDGDYIGGLRFGNNDSTGTPPHGTGIKVSADDVYGHIFMDFLSGNRDAWDNSVKSMRISNGGDISFYEPTGTSVRINYDASTEFVVNEDSADFDFRVESDTNTHALFVEGSSGNVLLGKTSTSIANTGLIFHNANNYLAVTRSSDAPLILNRTTSDGDIAEFRKDNTTVGSIGNRNDSFYIRTEAGTSGSGIRLSDAYVMPCASDGSNSDATTDLGLSGSRFKDLYLSGGVKSSGGNNIFNGDGGDNDFRVESDANTHALFVEGSTSRVGIGVSSPAAKLDVDGGYIHVKAGGTNSLRIGSDGSNDIYMPTGQNLNISATDRIVFKTGSGLPERLRIENSGDVIINETSVDQDFRVESDGNNHALFVRGSDSRVIFGGNSTINGANGEFVTGSGASSSTYFAIRNNTTSATTSASTRLDLGVWTDNSAYPTPSGTTTGSINFMAQANDNGYSSSGIHSYILTGGALGRSSHTARTIFYNKDNNAASAIEYMRLDGGEEAVVINQEGYNNDFRVESDTDTHLLYCDGGASHVNIKTSTDLGSTFNVAGTTTMTRSSTSGAYVATGATLSIQGNGNYNSNYFGTDRATVAIRSNEPTNSGWNPTINITTIRQSLTTNNGATGGIGFTTIDDSNNTGIDDAGRIVLHNEVNASAGSPTGLHFYNNPGGPKTTAAQLALKLGSTEAVFNESSNDIDFRVESNNNSAALAVDSGLDLVRIGSNGCYTATLIKSATVGTNSSADIIFDMSSDFGIGAKFNFHFEIDGGAYGNSLTGPGVYKLVGGGYSQTAGNMSTNELVNQMGSGSWAFSHYDTDAFKVTVSNTHSTGLKYVVVKMTITYTA